MRFMMKHIWVIFLSMSVLAQVDAHLGLRQNEHQAVALTHARIYLSWDRMINDGTLVIRDQRVVAVGEQVAIPPDARVVDVRGKVIFPGFLDMVSDYGLPKTESKPRERRSKPIYENQRRGANSWNAAIHAETEWSQHFAPDPSAAKELLKQGFVAVHSLPQDGVFRGAGVVVTLGQRKPAEEILAKGFHGLSFNKGNSPQLYPSSLMGSVALLRQTFYDLQWYRTVKNRNEGFEPNAPLEALSNYQGPFIWESKSELDLLRADLIAREFSLQTIYIGSNTEYQRLDEIVDLKRRIILPLDFPVAPKLTTVALSMDASLHDMRHWERAPANAARLAERNVPFAITTHGLKQPELMWAALRKSIQAGLEPHRALRALTAEPANWLGLSKELGSLDVGKRACFSIWFDSPFENDGAHWLATWVDGQPTADSSSPASIDWRGKYELHMGDRVLTLDVSGVPTKLKGQLGEGETDQPVSELKADGTELTFHAPLDGFAWTGIYRFRIQAQADRIQGQMVSDFGVAIDFDVNAIEAPVEDHALKPTSQVADSAGPVSRLTMPNQGFGFEQLPQSETVLFRNATVWTCAELGRQEATDVLISAGVIQAVGRGLSAPAGARVVDASGKHLTPGIIDEHSHIAIAGGVNEFSHAVTAEVRIGDVLNPDDISIYRALAGGVTSAQLLHGSANPIGGQAQVIKMRWGASAEGLKFSQAPPSIKFALGENVKQSNAGDHYDIRYPQTRMGVETLMRDRFNAAQEYGKGWDDYHALKPRQREGVLPPRRDLQLQALHEILKSERFIHCHSYVQSEILMLMSLAESFGFRIQTFTHILEGYKVALEMAQHGAGGSTFADWWAYKFEVYDAIPHNPCLMTRAGVVTSVNSDSSELMRRLNQDAAKAVMYCGMDEQEALKMVTLNPAIQLKIDRFVGSLETGKHADLVLWNDHPLSIYAAVEQTWVDGKLMFSTERDRLLRLAVEKERALLVQKILAEAGGGSKVKSEKNGGHWHCDDRFDVWGGDHAP